VIMIRFIRKNRLIEYHTDGNGIDYVSTLGLNEATIKKYMQKQEKHDIMIDELSVKEYGYPLRGIQQYICSFRSSKKGEGIVICST